jgi:thiol-disulfide isomerase/thioredoxin
VPQTLIVYGRSWCHLCDEMISGLRDLQARFVFELQVVDVDTDPVLERRFGEHVPVLMDGERELCRHRLEPASVSAYLAKLP